MRRVLLTLAQLAAFMAMAPVPAGAQTADDFFSPDELHEIRITIHSSDWERLKERYLENTYYPCEIRWRDLVVENVGIRSRGFGSRRPTKPGLRVDFDRYAPDQEFLGLKSVVLDNLTQDPSMMHETIAMRFFGRMGLPAPRQAHARLYVNDTYVGLYGVVESVDKKFLGRVFGADDQGGVENDGYLFEYRYQEGEPWFFNYLGRELDPYKKLFKPQTHERSADETLYRPIEEMLRAIEESPSTIWEELVSEFLDLGLFMRHVAVEAFLAEWDGILGYAGANNFYLYRFENKKRMQLIPWDKDNTFRALDYPLFSGIQDNHITRMAMQFSGLSGVFMQTLLDAAASAQESASEADARGWMEAEVDKVANLIWDAAIEDPVKAYTNDEFVAAVDAMRDFSRRRSVWVQCDVYREIDPGRVGPECFTFDTAHRR